MRQYATAIALLLALTACQPDTTDDPRAWEAYAFAATAMQVSVKGTTPPPVRYVTGGPDGKFAMNGVRVVGNYTWKRNLFGKLIHEQITVVLNEYVFSNLAHEMVHAIRARRGDETTEAEAEAVEAAARKARGTPPL